MNIKSTLKCAAVVVGAGAASSVMADDSTTGQSNLKGPSDPDVHLQVGVTYPHGAMAEIETAGTHWQVGARMISGTKDFRAQTQVYANYVFGDSKYPQGYYVGGMAGMAFDGKPVVGVEGGLQGFEISGGENKAKLGVYGVKHNGAWEAGVRLSMGYFLGKL